MSIWKIRGQWICSSRYSKPNWKEVRFQSSWWTIPWVTGQIGFDGLWSFPDGHAVIVEVKTTNAYQIDLDTITGYRRQLISQGEATEENSSALIIIGRDDRNTINLESQIRGSRYAWNIRVISVDALTRLMRLKETVWPAPNNRICIVF